jgi:uncharacterized protein (DUF1778 family)
MAKIEDRIEVRTSAIGISVDQHTLLTIQQAATIDGKLVPDFIEDAVRIRALEILKRDSSITSENFRQAHRRGQRDGRDERLVEAINVLADAGHVEAATFLNQQYASDVNGDVAPSGRHEAGDTDHPRKATRVETPAERF